jgi:hypothetical protein
MTCLEHNSGDSLRAWRWRIGKNVGERRPRLVEDD